MNYDFDMVPVIPAALRKALQARGLADDRLAERVALFRDPATIAALRAADPRLREIFTNAGFALAESESGLATGLYDIGDDAARLSVLMRLKDGIARRTTLARTGDWGGFSLDRFLDQIEAARGVRISDGANVVSFDVPPGWREGRGTRLMSLAGWITAASAPLVVFQNGMTFLPVMG